jgi:hypothetical protein
MILHSFLKRPWQWAIAALVLFTVLLFLLWRLNPAAPQDNSAVTQAHVTVAARLTEASLATRNSMGNPGDETAIATLTPPERPQPATPSPVESTTIIPDPSLPHTPSPTLPCDRAAPGIPMDITIPDDTQFLPGETFTKIWRLQNIGACTWTSDYAARFFYGDRIGAAEIVFLGREVLPGDNVDIAVDMQAPNEPGSYQGNWKLVNARGQFFGIGPRGDAPFWVRIMVLRIATQTPTPTITSTPTSTPTPPVTSTATHTSTPPVQSSGEFNLLVNQSIDLDSGLFDPQDGIDLDYRLENTFHVLVPQDEADLGVYSADQPGLENCRSSALSKAPIALESLSPGIHLCYRTDAGRYGWLRYDSLNADGSADLAFHTWANP